MVSTVRGVGLFFLLLMSLHISCGIIPPTLRDVTLKGHPAFEESAEKARFTHKWASFRKGNTVHSGEYQLDDATTADQIRFDVNAQWERAEEFKLRPTITILGYEITSAAMEKMHGLRLTIIGDPDTSKLEVVGIFRQIHEDRYSGKNKLRESFISFPCNFEMFQGTKSLGSVTIHGPRAKSYSLYRDFDFEFEGRLYSLQSQCYERLSYATIKAEDELLAVIDIKLSGVNKRGGDVLFRNATDGFHKTELFKMFLIADFFTHTVLRDDGPR